MNDFVPNVNQLTSIPSASTKVISRSINKQYTLSAHAFVQPNCSSRTYISFLANISNIQELKSYKQASTNAEWIAAMNKEIETLEANGTWELTQLPSGKKSIGCKWVYKVKYNHNGTVERYKAKLVAKGFNQIQGIAYFPSCSQVSYC